MPTEDMFFNRKSLNTKIWEASPFNKGDNYLSYIDPSYRQTLSDFPVFTSFWALRNTYEVANYPIRILPTAGNFDIWNTYRVNSISTLYSDFDTRNLESKQVSPGLPGGFYKRGTIANQFYIIEENGKTFLLQIDFEFKVLSTIEETYYQDFTLNTGNKFRDFIFEKLSNLQDINEELEDQSEIPDDDTSGALGKLKEFIVNLVTESNISDIIGLWVPVNYSVTEINTQQFETGSKSNQSKNGEFPLLPIGLIGAGLVTGMVPLSFIGAGLLLINRKPKSIIKTKEVINTGEVFINEFIGE